MIIYNIGGLLVGALSGLTFIIFINYIPADYQWLAFGFTTLLYSVVGEVRGYKPRLFFLPMWLLAVVFIAYHAHAQFGFLGMIATGALSVALMAGLIVATSRITEKFADAKLAELERTDLSPARREFWNLASKTIHMRILGDQAPDYQDRNRRIARCLRRAPLSPAGPSPAYALGARPAESSQPMAKRQQPMLAAWPTTASSSTSTPRERWRKSLCDCPPPIDSRAPLRSRNHVLQASTPMSAMSFRFGRSAIVL